MGGIEDEPSSLGTITGHFFVFPANITPDMNVRNIDLERFGMESNLAHL